MRETVAVQAGVAAETQCFHCGQRCGRDALQVADKSFCCLGCKTVYELLSANRLGQYYDLQPSPGARPETSDPDRFAYLDDPSVRQRLVDFDDGRLATVTLHLPAIHCVACLWLLENLHRLQPGVHRAQVDFLRRQATIHFEPATLSLRELVVFLARIGYEPRLQLADLAGRKAGSPNRALYMKLGVAGFAFGNVMLMSFPAYFGLETAGTPWLVAVFGVLCLGLALPVLLYSASDYLRAGWLAVRQRQVTIDLPISLGIVALFVQSAVTVVRGGGPGFLDSFTGLIFFLLLGRVFQTKTYASLTFDRDYTAYFPVSVLRRDASGEARIPLTKLVVGDRIVVRHREIVPADAIVLGTAIEVDYSFVTGEADPVRRQPGDLVYAGGRQLGPAAELQVVKAVSQSYLTQLWDNPLFRKEAGHDLASLTNRVSRNFTLYVSLVALGAGLWWLRTSPATALQVAAAVLIVACPCALALAAPFTFGTAARLLERRQGFARNPSVLEALARVELIVFDKTGTLTEAEHTAVSFAGTLSAEERGWVGALARQSLHPLSAQVAMSLPETAAPVQDFAEQPGQGLAGTVAGQSVRLGSAAWVGAPAEAPTLQPTVHVSIAGGYRGYFELGTVFRTGLAGALTSLAGRYRLALLTGDSERQAPRLRELFGDAADLHFRQSPADKLAYVAQAQQAGRQVLMVGDGLNDAGALKQSNVGVAVCNDLSAFAPACDLILAAPQLPELPRVLRLARASRRIVLGCFGLSFCYNVVGLSVAASGHLSPLICAILMPLSSITVVATAVGATHLAGWLIWRKSS